VEWRWERRYPFRDLDREAVERLVTPAAPLSRVQAVAPLTRGLRNASYRVDLAESDGSARSVVLRLYTADPAACRREAALARLVGSSVPVPETLYVDPTADPPYAVTTWIDGLALDEVLASGDPTTVEAVSYAAGAVLAAIHRFDFPSAGFLGPNLEVVQPLQMGGAGWAAYVEMFLGERGVGDRLGADLARRLRRLVAARASSLDVLHDDRALVHADYKPWNLLVRRDDRNWCVAGVLDSEFAFAGSPLFDLSIFLRQEPGQPPGYARGFEAGYRDAGGHLPDDWRDLALLLDVLNLCSMLDGPSVGEAFLQDGRQIIAATLARFGII
jgi:aminoglycoside phosphotransferase (APT) family kinase protein